MSTETKKLPAVVITYPGFGGARTQVENVLETLNGSRDRGMIIVTPRKKPSRAAERKLKERYGENVKVVINKEEIIDAIREVDPEVVFSLFFINGSWPDAEETFQEIGRMGKKRVVMGIGTQESRLCSQFTSMKAWDAWWAIRQNVLDHNKDAIGSLPTVLGCNVFKRTCPLAPEELVEMQGSVPRLVSNTRFSTGKGALAVMDILDDTAAAGWNSEAWGWNMTESGISFYGAVKSDKGKWAQWEKLRSSGIVRGPYERSSVGNILKGARYTVDFTISKGDATTYGDGGIQHCQAESIDWGAIPIVHPDFYAGSGWDEIVLRPPDDCFTGKPGYRKPLGNKIAQWLQEKDKEWDPAGHVEKIKMGRKYLDEAVSKEKFLSSWFELKEKLNIH